MNKTNNPMLSKPFLTTLLWKQNGHHRHGVFLHTMKVVYHTIKAKDYKMVPASFLHDFGKPVTAFQKEEDIPLKKKRGQVNEKEGSSKRNRTSCISL